MHVRLQRAVQCLLCRTLLLATQSCSCSFHTGLASTSATVSLPWKLPGSSSATYSASDSLPSLFVSEYSKSCFVRRLVAFKPASRRLHQPSRPALQSRACLTMPLVLGLLCAQYITTGHCHGVACSKL